jgi:sulfoxide reductase heme-binding subunit YedZ
MGQKQWIWVLLAVPATVILLQFAADAISYGQTIHRSGQWSAALLLLALSVTPLQRLAGTTAWIGLLVLYRRALGVASFGYAALHTAVYMEHKWGADLILRESFEPSLGTGWLALFVLLILAVTSNGASVKALRGRWKTLHRSVYLGAALTFAHWLLATFDPLSAYICLTLIVSLELLRLGATRS